MVDLDRIVWSPLCRLKKGKELEKEEAIKEVKKNIHLIKAPHAGTYSDVVLKAVDFFLNKA